MKETSTYDKHSLARVFFLFWTVKDKSLELGRIKSCRAPTDIKKFISGAGGSPQVLVDKLSQKIYGEHYKNLKCILDESGIAKSRWVDVVHPEPRRGRFKIECTYDQARKNNALRVLRLNSNLPDNAKSLFLLGDGPSSFIFRFAARQNSFTRSALINDCDSVADFIKKFENTMKLVGKVAPSIPDLHDFDYFAPNPLRCHIEFGRLPTENLTAESVLDCPFKITEPSVVQPERVADGDGRSTQDRLQDYVQNVILARR